MTRSDNEARSRRWVEVASHPPRDLHRTPTKLLRLLLLLLSLLFLVLLLLLVLSFFPSSSLLRQRMLQTATMPDWTSS